MAFMVRYCGSMDARRAALALHVLCVRRQLNLLPFLLVSYRMLANDSRHFPTNSTSEHRGAVWRVAGKHVSEALS